MSREKAILGLFLCAVLVAGSVAVMAGIGGNDDQASDLDFGDNGFPDPDDCVCPLNYDPVVCVQKNPDGTLSTQTFSNACFAGCAGYTHCLSGFLPIR